MCGTSHLMYAELKPILYETVLWNDSLHERLLKSLDDLATSEFRHTRYVLPKTLPPTRAKVLCRFVILDERHFESLQDLVTTVLPSLRVIVKKERRLLPAFVFWPSLPDCSVKLYIVRNASLCSILSVMERPLKWCLDDGATRPGWVQGVSYIDVAARATLIIGNSRVGSPVKSFGNSALVVNIPKEEDQEMAQPARLLKSLEAIRQMMLPPGYTTRLRQVEFHFEDIKPENVEIWIDQVSEFQAKLDEIIRHFFIPSSKVRRWMETSPGLKMEVWIRRNDLDVVNFRGIVGRFQAMYESLWQEDPRFVDQDTGYDPPFFELYSFPSDDQPEKFSAEFRRLEEREGFAVAIESYPDGDRANAELILPVISFSMVAWSLPATRKRMITLPTMIISATRSALFLMMPPQLIAMPLYTARTSSKHQRRG
jgi:hypothetical protein